MSEVNQYNDTQIKILMVLSDDAGYAQRDISEKIKISPSNISSLINILIKDDIISMGTPRKTTRLTSKRPNAKEVPLYISKDLETYRTIIINIHDRIEEHILNIGMATRHEEAVRREIKLEKDKLRLDNKGLWTRDDVEKLNKKFEDRVKFKGHGKSFYEMERNKYMDYIEKFLLSPYTKKIIEEFGFNAVLRIGIIGTLDIWYMNTLIAMALDKKLITEDEAEIIEYPRDFL